MRFFVGALACFVVANGHAFASPPIQNPGAPGQSSRTITAEEAVDMSRSFHLPADARFMQHMIVHHAQAVEMNQLIEGRTDNRSIILIGQRIAASQESEMAFMRRWLTEREEPVEDAALHAGHAHHGDHSAHEDHNGHSGHSGHGDHASDDPGDMALMPGMLSPNQMAALAAATGSQFDQLFLEGMIIHHQGAIDMVDALLDQPGTGEDPQLGEFLNHVVADQTAEILRMQNLLSELASHSEEEHHHHD